MTDMMGQFVWLRPGVAMPDWSLVTTAAPRRALAAMAEVEGLLARLANIEPLEDKLWRAVLEDYAETGRAPTASEVAARTGIGPEMVRGTLRRLQARDVVVLDESGEAITGAYPFTERTTRHRVRLKAHRLNAMCAIDALGVGAMYGEDVEIESACRLCGRPIVIETRDRGHDLATAVPDGTVVWVGLRYADKCAATSLCQVLAFFCSDEHLRSWRRIKSLKRRRRHAVDACGGNANRQSPLHAVAGSAAPWRQTIEDRTMIKTGIGGAAIIALCCLGPALVPLLGALSLSAWLSWAGYVLLPALVAIVAIAAVGVFYLHRRSGADTASCDAEPSRPQGIQR